MDLFSVIEATCFTPGNVGDPSGKTSISQNPYAPAGEPLIRFIGHLSRIGPQRKKIPNEWSDSSKKSDCDGRFRLGKISEFSAKTGKIALLG